MVARTSTFLDKEISYFVRVTWKKSAKNHKVGEILDIIRGESTITDLKNKIQIIRDTTEPEINKTTKSQLPAVTWAGLFTQRGNQYLTQFSGLVCIDLDHLDNPEETKDILRADKFVAAMFISPSGKGLKVIIQVNCEGKDYGFAYQKITTYMKDTYGLNVDQGAKALSQLCFISYDPELYLNASASVFEVNEQVAPLPRREFQAIESVSPAFEIVSETPELTSHSSTDPRIVESALMSIPPDPEYDEWLRIISCVLAMVPQEQAIEMLKKWSPERVAGEYAAKARTPLTKINPRELFIRAKKNGWKYSIPDCSTYTYQHQGDSVTTTDSRVSTNDQKILDLLNKFEYDPNHTPPKEKVTYSLDGTEISHQGNIMVITAEAKAGKSAFISACIASTFASDDSDCLGVTSENVEGKAVIHFDTEQSRYDHYYMINRILRRAGTTTLPDWLHSYGVVEMNLDTLLPALALCMKTLSEKHGGIHSVYLDQVGDFVLSLNSEEDSNKLVSSLIRLANQYDCPIICVLHRNRGGEKGRGHLGSQFERKAETVLTIDQKNGMSVVYGDKMRRKPIYKEQGVKFAWNDEYAMHMTKVNDGHVTGVNDTDRTLVEAVWSKFDSPKLRFKNIKSELMTLTRQSESTVKRFIREWTDAGLIIKSESGEYTKA